MTRTPHLWIRIIGYLLIAVEVIAIVSLWLIRDQAPESTLIISAAPMVIGAVVVVVILSARISIGTDVYGIVLRFAPIWTKRIPWAELDSMSPVANVTVQQFGGIGLRKSINGDTGILWNSGPAVTLRTTTKHTYVVQCEDPERVIADLTRRRR